MRDCVSYMQWRDHWVIWPRQEKQNRRRTMQEFIKHLDSETVVDDKVVPTPQRREKKNDYVFKATA